MREGLKRPPDWRVWLLLIVGLSAALRFAVADHSLWFDEQAAVFFSDQPFARLWSDWMLRETNPALYYSVLRVWRMMFGSSDFAIRGLSVSASLVAIVLAAGVARRVYGARAGLIAAALAALSGQQLYFAEQARSYIFVLCAALVAIDALVKFCAAEDQRARSRAAAIYAVAAAAAIYLHTTMVLFPAIALPAVIAADPRCYARRPSLLLPLVVADLAILVGASWAIRNAVLQVTNHGDNIAAIGLADTSLIIVYPLQTLFLSGHSDKFDYAIALLVLVTVASFAAVDWRRVETRLLAAIGMFAVLTFGAVGMFVPVFVPRTIFWLSAVPLVLAAGALARLSFHHWGWGAFTILAVLLAVDARRIVPKLEQEDWNTPVHLLSQRPGALLLVQGEAMAVLADEACRRQLRRNACPYVVVAALDPEDRFDSWARGTFPGPKVPIVDLPGRVAGRTVFLFRKAAFHNLPDMLHEHGLGHGIPAGGPPLLGPLPGAALR